MLRCNYDLSYSTPLTWEAFFDPVDGPAASAPSGVIEGILSELGYAGVSTHDPFVSWEIFISGMKPNCHPEHAGCADKPRERRPYPRSGVLQRRRFHDLR